MTVPLTGSLRHRRNQTSGGWVRPWNGDEIFVLGPNL